MIWPRMCAKCLRTLYYQLKYIHSELHAYEIPPRKKHAGKNNRILHNQLKNYSQLDGRKFVVIIMVVVVRYLGIQTIFGAYPRPYGEQGLIVFNSEKLPAFQCTNMPFYGDTSFFSGSASQTIGWST